MAKEFNWLIVALCAGLFLIGVGAGYYVMPEKVKTIASDCPDCQVCPAIPECPDMTCPDVVKCTTTSRTPTETSKVKTVNPLRPQLDPEEAKVPKLISLKSTRSCRSWLINQGYSEDMETPFCWHNRNIVEMENVYKKINKENVLMGCQMYYYPQKCEESE